MATVKNAAKMAQAILVGSGANIAIDGVWGKRSQSAFAASQGPVKDLAKLGAKTISPNVSWAELTGSQKTGPQMRIVQPSPEIAGYIKQAASEFGLDHAELLSLFAIESAFKPGAVSPSGTYKGIGQVGAGAWSEARQYILSRGLGDIGPHSNWRDARSNVRAAAAYAKVLQRQLRAKGYKGPFTGAVMYLAHQQGAGGFNQLLNAANGSRRVPDSAVRRMAANPPQDGKGVTVDPSEFISRWSAVSDRLKRAYS